MPQKVRDVCVCVVGRCVCVCVVHRCVCVCVVERFRCVCVCDVENVRCVFVLLCLFLLLIGLCVNVHRIVNLSFSVPSAL